MYKLQHLYICDIDINLVITCNKSTAVQDNGDIQTKLQINHLEKTSYQDSAEVMP